MARQHGWLLTKQAGPLDRRPRPASTANRKVTFVMSRSKKIPNGSLRSNSAIRLPDLERLNTWLPETAAALRPGAPVKARPDGGVRIGNKGALALGPGTGLWYDHEAGEGGRDALSLIRHLGAPNPAEWASLFLTEHEGTGSLTDDPSDHALEALEASSAAARYFLDAATPVADTPAAAYLAGRGVDGPCPDNLKFVPEARLGEGALLAVVASPDGPSAIQVTYLDAKGTKSATMPQRRIYRLRSDWSSAGCFSLTLAAAPARTVIAEGVEDALSLYQAGAGATVIASFGVGNLGKAPVDPDQPVVVFKDGDDPDSPAAKGLEKGVDRLILQGADVAVTDTPLGADANSILQAEGSAVLLALVDAAAPAELSIDGHVARCADLSITEYEEVRTALAKKLGVRVSFLDKQVSAVRREADEDDVPQNVLGIEDIEPWPDPVVLADALNDAAQNLTQYVAAGPELIHTSVLWAAHTHILDMINVSPRLAAQAAGPGCGKTVLMEAIGNLVPRPLSASSITAASVFRIIEEIQPTLLLDEADQMLADRSSPLVGVLNSSHRKSSAFVMRTEEVLPGQFQPVRFSTWAAVMFAGIRELPPTLQDRSVVLFLRRAKPGEVRQHLRDGKCPALAECAQKLARWASDLVDLPEVVLPPTLSNRIGDNWRPLLAIAEIAGGTWPVRAMEAAMAAAQQQEQGLISALLEDIHLVFGKREQILSQELVNGLLSLDEKPYGEINRGREITTNWLARQLKGVVTQPTKTMRDGKDRKKGYPRAAFADAWERYGINGVDEGVRETPSKTNGSNVTTGQPLSGNGYTVTDGSQLSPDVTEASPLPDSPNPNATAGRHVVTDDTDGNEGFSDTRAHNDEAAVDGGDDTCLL
jgi:putative DNA primase/helicase